MTICRVVFIYLLVRHVSGMLSNPSMSTEILNDEAIVFNDIGSIFPTNNARTGFSVSAFDKKGSVELEINENVNNDKFHDRIPEAELYNNDAKNNSNLSERSFIYMKNPKLKTSYLSRYKTQYKNYNLKNRHYPQAASKPTPRAFTEKLAVDYDDKLPKMMVLDSKNSVRSGNYFYVPLRFEEVIKMDGKPVDKIHERANLKYNIINNPSNPQDVRKDYIELRKPPLLRPPKSGKVNTGYKQKVESKMSSFMNIPERYRARKNKSNIKAVTNYKNSLQNSNSHTYRSSFSNHKFANSDILSGDMNDFKFNTDFSVVKNGQKLQRVNSEPPAITNIELKRALLHNIANEAPEKHYIHDTSLQHTADCPKSKKHNTSDKQVLTSKCNCGCKTHMIQPRKTDELLKATVVIPKLPDYTDYTDSSEETKHNPK